MAKLIMVVNDTQEILELFETILTDEGFNVSLHSYRMQDLEAVKKVQPDLIIVDQMIGNEANGWQFIQKLHMDSVTATIPIIVCSAEIRLLKELEGHLKAKQISIVLKPFDIEDLVQVVKLVIGEP